MTSSGRPVWFITGSSTGFGRTLASAVLQRGWRAVVMARDVDAARDLVAGHEDRALAPALDVTGGSAIAAGVGGRGGPVRRHRRARQQCRLRRPRRHRGG